MTKENNSLNTIKKVSLISLLINFVVAIIKIILGVMGQSQAIIADGIHSFSDMISDVVLLFSAQFFSKPADDSFQHGYHKIEVIVIFIIGFLLFLVGFGTAYHAVLNLISREIVIPEKIAAIAAVISIICKEALYRYTIIEAKKIKSTALVANAWHHRSDALSSIPSFLGVLISSYFPDYYYIDSFAALIVSGFIIHVSWELVNPCLDNILDRSAPKDLIDKIYKTVLETQGVLGSHKLRTRYLGPATLSIDLHIQVDGNLSVDKGHNICGEAKAKILNKFEEIIDVIIHLEPEHD
ncbi:MAG: cation-efflux pump [Candidatus Cloacimonadota bacterium]|nr:MAG: cation-efflux pump [Candidatus Cloacimonadota bacterium]